MSRSKKNRRIKKRKTRKRGGDTTAGILEKVKMRKENQTPTQRWKELKKDMEARKRREKMQADFKTTLDRNLPKTKKAIKKRDKKHEKFKPVTSKKPIVDQVSGKNIFGFERSAEKIDKLTEKKQKKSDKAFNKNLLKQLNIAIKDPSHPDHFQYRRRRLLEIIRNKHKKEYDSFLKCKDKGLTSNPGCSMEIYKAIEPNGEKRGDKLLDAIAEKYGITPDMEKYKKVKKGISAKKRSASAGRKRRKKTKKKRHIITRKNKRKRIRTKKRRRGGMPKAVKPVNKRLEALKSFRPIAARKKFKKPKISRSPSVRSSLNTAKMFQSEQQQTQNPQLSQMMEDLSVSSETQQ